MQYIESPSKESPKHDMVLFLGGGITNCPDWQKKIVKRIEEKGIRGLTVWNPRRENFPIDDPSAAEEQITWEYERLRKATVLCFWFPKETMCPIVLFELGGALERKGQKIIIGMDEDYKRRQDVEIQTALTGRDGDPIRVDIHVGFESFASALIRMLEPAKKEAVISVDQGASLSGFSRSSRSAASCPKCGSSNTTHVEVHPDTDMNDMVLKCRDCGYIDD